MFATPRRLHQRADDRPAGPLRQLRARRPPGHPAEHDGSITVLADSYAGHAAEQPERCRGRTPTASSGSPTRATGSMTDYEGHQASRGDRRPQRLPASTRPGALDVVADDFTQPNGLAFSADERQLYVVDSEEHPIRVFDVHGARLTRWRGVRRRPCGYDGIRFDTGGRLWGAAHDGLHCYEPDGTLMRQAAAARDRGQPRLRWPPAQPALPDRHDLAVHAAGQLPRRAVPVLLRRGVRVLGPGRARQGERGCRDQQSHAEQRGDRRRAGCWLQPSRSARRRPRWAAAGTARRPPSRRTTSPARGTIRQRCRMAAAARRG